MVKGAHAQTEEFYSDEDSYSESESGSETESDISLEDVQEAQGRYHNDKPRTRKAPAMRKQRQQSVESFSDTESETQSESQAESGSETQSDESDYYMSDSEEDDYPPRKQRAPRRC